MRTERRVIAAGTLLLLGLGLFVALRLAVVSDITQFLPDGAGGDVHLARELATGELSRTMVLLLDAGDTDTAVRAGRDFEAALRQEPRVGPALLFLDGGPPAGIEQALWEIYQPHRFGLLAADAEAAAARLSPAAIEAAVLHMKQRLALPISTMLSRVAPADPLLILPDLFERLLRGRGEGLRVVDGRFVTADGTAAVLFLATRAPSSDGSVQAPLLQGVRAAFAAVDARFGGQLSLHQSGANRFAVRAEAAIRADIQRVSIGSSVGIAVLFVLLFRSLRLLLLVLPVLGAGFLSGTTACLLVFGEVHGLTLAFGAALIGVSVDYVVHFHCHHVFAPEPSGPRATLRGIGSGLLLGAATTVVGFVALLVSDFPGLRQLAVFAAAGITAALLATVALLPGLAARSPAPTAVSRWLVARLRALLAPRRRWLLALPAVLVAITAAVGVPQLRWNDALADLNRLDPQLQREDAAVRARVLRYEQRRLVIAVGTDVEQALQANDRVAGVLQQAQQRGELSGWRSLAQLLPSQRQQREVDAVVRQDDQLWPRLQHALVEAGFRTDAFEPFHQALLQPAPPPLRLADLEASALQPLVRPFVVHLDEGIGCVSFLHELRDEAALRLALAAIPGARLIDIERSLSDAYGAYRQRLLSLWLCGMVAVLLLVALRHRALRPTAVAFLPAALAAAGTVGLLSLCGVELNMLSLVALLMVVSMGVDYGVFLAETGGEPRRLDATHLAVFVAGVTTVLGFGLLAISRQPALSSLGLAAGTGVLLCLVLAPSLCALAASRRTSP